MKSASEAPASAAGNTSTVPDLAGVVIALGAPASAVDAVRSLLEQDPPVEVVVVNSGGGDMAARLREAGLDVPVVEREERLFAGAVRNLGIAATRAPYVGFLAADCRAAPGWSRHRLRAHRAGQDCRCKRGDPIPSTQRGPLTSPSFAGAFRASGGRTPPPTAPPTTVPCSMNTACFAAISASPRIPSSTLAFPIATSPSGPRAFGRFMTALPVSVSLLRDQYARGYRASERPGTFRGSGLQFNPRWTYMQIRSAVRISRRIINRRDLRTVRIAWLLLPFAIGAYALGGAVANRRRDGAPKTE